MLAKGMSGIADARSSGTRLHRETRVDPQIELPPERKLITLKSEYVEALCRLLALAQRTLRIFDPDLEPLGLHSEERCRVLREFLLRSRNNRVYIALHETDFVARRAPRLVSLLGTFSGSLFIHRTQGDAARVPDCFVLCDELHFVRRGVASQPRGALYLNDPHEGRGMRERFDEIWQSSAPAVSATQSGL